MMPPFMRLSLTTKVFLGFMALLAVFAMLAYVSVGELREVSQDLRTVTDGHLVVARHVARLEALEQNRIRNLERIMETREVRAQSMLLTVARRYYPDVIRLAAEETLRVSQEQIWLASRSGSAGARDRGVFFRNVIKRIGHVMNLHEKLNAYTEQLVTDLRQNRDVRARKVQLQMIAHALGQERRRLDQEIAKATENAVRRAAIQERAAVWRVLITTGVGLVVGLFLTFLAAVQLRPIKRLARYARALSRGDYTQSIHIHGDSELVSLGEELSLMARALKDRETELGKQARELEQAYRRVDELKRYHERIVRSLNTAVLVTNRQIVLTSANPASEHSFGLSPKALIGSPLQSLPLGVELEARLGPLQRCLDAPDVAHITAMPLGDRLADVSLAPLKNELGGNVGLVVSLEDVTEAVQTKEALIRSERLAAIGRMSAHVTHEIRNPLSSIGLNTEMLTELIGHMQGAPEDQEEAQQIGAAIGREVDRLTTITGDYLKFARLPEPVLRPVQVEDLLQAIASFMRRDLDAAQVQLELELEAPIPEIHLDADQIRQALLNLIRNGKESMPEGGPLCIRAANEPEGLIIEVKDQGHGIAPDNLSRVFDPFYSTKLTGTGLGLPLTAQIIQEHGGRLTVSSTLGEGTCFRVCLPLVPKTAVPALSRSGNGWNKQAAEDDDRRDGSPGASTGQLS